MTEKPLVSIIIPVYNTEKYLRSCVESALNQSYRNLEIIIVIDGSPDKSYLIGKKICEEDNRVSLINQKNTGLSGARNTGILTSRGKYILFLDSDDRLILDAVENLVSIALAKKADVVIPDRYTKINEDSSKQSLELHFKSKDQNIKPSEFALEFLIGKGRAWRASALLYNNEIIKNNSIVFPVGYTAEDFVFNLKFFSHSKKLAFFNRSTLINLKRKGSITTTYNDNQLDIFLYLDKKVNEFFKMNNLVNKRSKNLQDSLLRRNVILTITGTMSKDNKSSFIKKYKKSNEIFKNNRILGAFKHIYFEPPYFNSYLTIFYFRVMNLLISSKMYILAFALAWSVGQVRKSKIG